MATPTKVDLGAFAQGEVPPPLEVTYTDFDNVAVDITGFAVQTNIEEELAGGAGLGTGTTAISDGPAGKLTYTWVKADMANTGEYTLQTWADDGTNYYASDLYTYSVYDGPGVAPT